jgi:plastocyanin
MIAAAGAAAIAIPAARAAGAPATHTVVIGNFVFAPDSLTVKAGDHIEWINRDIVPHTATATDKSWDTGKIAAGSRAELTVSRDFVESYFCRFHPNMKARLKVS